MDDYLERMEMKLDAGAASGPGPPAWRIGETLRGDRAGSRAARTLLPIAIAAPLLTTALRLLLESRGLLSELEGGALAAVVNAIVLCFVVLWLAALLNAADEAQVEQAEETRHSSALLKSVFDSPLMGIFYWRLNGTITDVNLKFAEMLGFPPDAARRGKLRWSELTPPEYAQLEATKFKEICTRHSIVPYEKEFFRADGSRQPVLIGAAMLDSETREGVAFALDVSEVQQARRELLERNHELELANTELDSFSYSVSHDLRAPLRAIEGFSKALEEDYGPQLDEQAQHYIARVRAGTLRMAHLIDDLLHLSRVGRAELKLAAVDVSALAEAVAGQLREVHPERAVELRIQPGMAAFGDARLVHIVLENLLGNAWKFSAGRDPAVIEVGQRAGRQGMEFYVLDNGAGFDMAYVGKLFTAFQRLHRADQFDGTGIGLAIVRRIISRHGGEVRAEGASDQGARFSFTLPRQGGL